MFGIKKSHEMISYILVGMALLRKSNHGSSTKPSKLTHMTQDELYDKSHEGFMLSLCQENASIGQKILFGALSGYCFDQSERLTSVAVMMFDPK